MSDEAASSRIRQQVQQEYEKELTAKNEELQKLRKLLESKDKEIKSLTAAKRPPTPSNKNQSSSSYSSYSANPSDHKDLFDPSQIIAPLTTDPRTDLPLVEIPLDRQVYFAHFGTTDLVVHGFFECSLLVKEKHHENEQSSIITRLPTAILVTDSTVYVCTHTGSLLRFFEVVASSNNNNKKTDDNNVLESITVHTQRDSPSLPLYIFRCHHHADVDVNKDNNNKDIIIEFNSQEDGAKMEDCLHRIQKKIKKSDDPSSNKKGFAVVNQTKKDGTKIINDDDLLQNRGNIVRSAMMEFPDIKTDRTPDPTKLPKQTSLKELTKQTFASEFQREFEIRQHPEKFPILIRKDAIKSKTVFDADVDDAFARRKNNTTGLTSSIDSLLCKQSNYSGSGKRNAAAVAAKLEEDDHNDDDESLTARDREFCKKFEIDPRLITEVKDKLLIMEQEENNINSSNNNINSNSSKAHYASLFQPLSQKLTSTLKKKTQVNKRKIRRKKFPSKYHVTLTIHDLVSILNLSEREAFIIFYDYLIGEGHYLPSKNKTVLMMQMKDSEGFQIQKQLSDHSTIIEALENASSLVALEAILTKILSVEKFLPLISRDTSTFEEVMRFQNSQEIFCGLPPSSAEEQKQKKNESEKDTSSNNNNSNNNSSTTVFDDETEKRRTELRKLYHSIMSDRIAQLPCSSSSSSSSSSKATTVASTIKTKLKRVQCFGLFAQFLHRLCSLPSPGVDFLSHMSTIDSINTALKFVISVKKENSSASTPLKQKEAIETACVDATFQIVSTCFALIHHSTNPKNHATAKSLFTNQITIDVLTSALRYTATTPQCVQAIAGCLSASSGILDEERNAASVIDAHRLMTNPEIVDAIAHALRYHATTPPSIKTLCSIIISLTNSGDNVDLAASGSFNAHDAGSSSVTDEAKTLFAKSKDTAIGFRDGVFGVIEKHKENKKTASIIPWVSDAIFNIIAETEKISRRTFIEEEFAQKFGNLRPVLRKSLEEEENANNFALKQSAEEFDITLKLVTPFHPKVAAVKFAESTSELTTSLFELAKEIASEVKNVSSSSSSSSSDNSPSSSSLTKLISVETIEIVNFQATLIKGDEAAKATGTFYTEFVKGARALLLLSPSSDDNEREKKQSQYRNLISKPATNSMLLLALSEAITPETLQTVCTPLLTMAMDGEDVKKILVNSGERLRTIVIRSLRIGCTSASLESVCELILCLFADDTNNNNNNETANAARGLLGTLDVYYSMNLACNYATSVSCIKVFSQVLLKIANFSEESTRIFSRQALCESLETVQVEMKRMKKRAQEKEKPTEVIEEAKSDLDDAYNFIRSAMETNKSRFIIIEELKQDCSRMRDAMGEADILRIETAQQKRDLMLMQNQLFARFKRIA